MSDALHSTGRGGAGNIGPEDEGTVYVDAGITREGDGSGALTSGRGGAGNIAHQAHLPHPSTQPAHDNSATANGGAAAAAKAKPPKSEVAVPQTATLPEVDDFHCGRGGEGNIHRKKYGGHSQPISPKDENGGQFPIVSKLKSMLGKKGESPLAQSGDANASVTDGEKTADTPQP